MKNKLCLLVVFFLKSFEIWATQTIDASIVKLDYVRPENFTGVAGSVIFDKVKIFRNDMMVILENADEVFDSEIFIRNQFLGFKGKYHSFGFVLDSESFLDSVNEANLLNASLSMDDQRLSFMTDHMKLDVQNAALEFNHSRLFCLKDPSSILEADGWLFGCLNNLILSPNSEGKNASLKIELRDENNQKISLEGVLDSLELTSDSVILKANKSEILMSDKEISLDDFKFTCAKSTIVPPINTDLLLQECLDNAHLSSDERPSIGFKFKAQRGEDTIYIDSGLKDISASKDNISGQLVNNEIVLDPFRVRGSNINFECQKRLNFEGNISSDLLNACINNFKATRHSWVAHDDEFDARYFFKMTGLNTTVEKLNLILERFQKVSNKDYPEYEITKGTVSAFNIKAECFNNNSLDDLEIPSLIKNCLKQATITVSNVIDSEDKNLSKIYKSYDLVMSSFNTFDRFDPTDQVASEKPVAKDVLVVLKDNVMTLTSKFYFMMGYKNIMLSGPTRFLDQSSEIEIEISKVKLPVPFIGRSTWFASKIFKKFLSSGSIRVKKNKIYIKVGSSK